MAVQLRLDLDLAANPGGQRSQDYTDAFRRLYYHMYSNSNTSRAERIISDLSKLLLAKLVNGLDTGSTFHKFLNGHGSANELILPLLLARYPSLIEGDDRFTIDDQALRNSLHALESLDFHHAPAHLLGDAFQALMGPRLRGDKGQFFTPKSVVRAMVAIAAPAPGAKVVDPACGTGGFLTEAAAYWQAQPSLPGQLIGMDKDADLSRLAAILLEIVCPGQGTLLHLNSLDWQRLAELPTTNSPLNADVVLTNPPFGTKIAIEDPAILRQYALGHQWVADPTTGRWGSTSQLRVSQDPQILFIELCVKLLKPGGRLGIILPEGVFGNRGAGYVWDFLRMHGHLYAMIDCPRTTFQPGTDTKTNILFFEKGAASDPHLPETVEVAVALHCGHDRRGRTTRENGEPYPDDFTYISKEWRERSAHAYWSRCILTDRYYLVPRYYDTLTSELLQQEARLAGGELMTFKQLLDKGWITIRKGDEVGAEAYGTGEVPFIRTSDIANFEISIDPTKSVSVEIYQSFAPNQALKPGDILLVVDGRYRIGRCAILNENNYQCVVQSHLRIISVQDGAPFTAMELLYLLSLPVVQRQIRNLVFIQSTLGSLGKRIEELKIPILQPSAAWKTRLDEFAYIVSERARLLAKLRGFEVLDVEL